MSEAVKTEEKVVKKYRKPANKQVFALIIKENFQMLLKEQEMLHFFLMQAIKRREK